MRNEVTPISIRNALFFDDREDVFDGGLHGIHALEMWIKLLHLAVHLHYLLQFKLGHYALRVSIVLASIQ